MRRLMSFVVAVLIVALVAPAAGLAWAWPARGEVLRPFSLGSDPYAAGQHRGVDVAADAGEDVLAPAGGEVTFAGTVPTHGRTISILTPDGYSVTLTHLGDARVKKGDVVEEGRPVARVGVSGTPEWDRPYVHLGVRVAAQAEGYVDPLSLLPPRGTTVAPPAPDPVPQPTPHAPPSPPAEASSETPQPPVPETSAPPIATSPAPAPSGTGASAQHPEAVDVDAGREIAPATPTERAAWSSASDVPVRRSGTRPATGNAARLATAEHSPGNGVSDAVARRSARTAAPAVAQAHVRRHGAVADGGTGARSAALSGRRRRRARDRSRRGTDARRAAGTAERGGRPSSARYPRLPRRSKTMGRPRHGTGWRRWRGC